MKRTISMMMGKGSISHNSRRFRAENIDSDRTHLNKSYCNTPIESVYRDLFDDALRRFNAKQKRADRCIDDYYEKIRTGKQEKLFKEIVVQVGDMENMSAASEDGQLAAAVLDEFMRGFEGRNPYLKVFSAHLHMDEATPHLHIDFVPFTTGSKRGLDTRVSLKQALANQGFEGGARGDTEWSQWVKSEKEQLAKVMERHGIEWERLGTHDEHLSVMDYKKVQRVQEVEELEKVVSDKRRAVKQLDKKAAAKQTEFAVLEGKAKSIAGVLLKKKQIDAIQPEAGTGIFRNTLKGVTLEDFNNIKKTALEYYILAEKAKELSARYVELKSKVPSETEKLEVEKQLANIGQLERDKARLQAVLREHGLDPDGRERGRSRGMGVERG